MFPTSSLSFMWMALASVGLNVPVFLVILWSYRSFGRTEIGAANTLSVTRALLAAPLTVLVVDGRFGIALVAYAICLVSDVIDGAMARASNRQSEFGAVLDPFADIVTTAGLYGGLVVQGILPLWVFLILMLRYVSLLVGIALLALNAIPLRIRATAVGKIVGVLQGVAGIMMLFVAATNMQWLEIIEVTLFPFLGIIFGWVIVSQLIIGVRLVRDGAKSAGS